MKRWVVALSGMVVVVALGALAANGAEEKEPAGKTLFLSNNCNSCHSVEAAGIERKKKADDEESDAKASTKKTVDLSSTGLTAKAEWLPKYLMKLEKTQEGKKHIKSWKGTDEELATLSAWLMEQKAPLKDEGADSKK